MDEPAEDSVSNEYYGLVQKAGAKRALYPENCARILYKTLKAEEHSCTHALIDLPDRDEQKLTNVLAEIQAVSLICNKELKELSGGQATLEDIQKRCAIARKKCKEAQTALSQIKKEPYDATTKYCC